MNSPAQIEAGSSKRNSVIPFRHMSYEQKMCAPPQNYHKSTSRPYFGIISIPFHSKKLNSSKTALRIARKPWTKIRKLKKQIQVSEYSYSVRCLLIWGMLMITQLTVQWCTKTDFKFPIVDPSLDSLGGSLFFHGEALRIHPLEIPTET